MEDSWYNFRVNFTVIIVIVIFVINSAAQYLLYSNQNVLADMFFGNHLGAAVANIRWMIGASLLVSAATMIFWGYLGDKYSKKLILTLSSLIWIIACFSIYFIPSITYSQLFLMQILFGLGFGAVWPICYSLLGDVVKAESRGKVFGILGIIVGVGSVIGLFLGSFSRGSWTTPFLIVSILGSGLILIFFIIGVDLKRGKAEDELKTVLNEGAVYTYEIKREHLTKLWKKRTNIYLFLQGIPGCIPWGVLLIVAPLFFESCGFDINIAILVVVLAQAPSAIGAVFSGWYCDRLAQKSQRSRLKFLAFSIIFPIPFFIAAFLLPFPFVGSAPGIFDAGFEAFLTGPFYILAFALIGIGSFLSSAAGTNYFAVIQAINEPEVRSTIISFQKVNDNTGTALGPGFAGVFGMLWGDRYAMAIATLFWIPCAYFWVRAMKTIETDVQEMKNLLTTRADELEQNLKSKQK
jgi:MFS family permease